MEKEIENVFLDMRREVYNVSALTPGRAAEILNQLSSMMGNIRDLELEKEMLYNERLREAQEEAGSKAQGETIANTSDQYRHWKQWKYRKNTAEDMISTLKYFLQQKEREMYESKYQT